MNSEIKNIKPGMLKILVTLCAVFLITLRANAVTLWVGETYTWDFGSSVMGSTYNMSVTSNGGYLSITGSGFYRNITPTQWFNGTAVVTAEWDYALYYGGPMTHTKRTLEIKLNDNKVSIHPTSLTLSPGETKYLSYDHQYNANPYVGAAKAYFSGGNSHFTVTSDGKVTGISPGTGYVNVYSKISSDSPACFVTVKEIEPTGARINDVSVFADSSVDLEVTVSPSNATVNSRTWSVKSGNDVVSISGSRLTGLKPGTATIYCTVNGSIRSNDATVTVKEPTLKLSSSFPEEGADGLSVFITPSVKYSHTISKGSSFDDVTLKESGGTLIEGNVELTGTDILFMPTRPLKPETTYIYHIPQSAVINKWGSNAQSDVNISFMTGPLEKASVTMTPVSGSYLTSGEGVKLIPLPADATVYYTLDGSVPTSSSSVYSDPINVGDGCTLKAIAMREGYEDSDIAEGIYYKSQSEILGYYPNDSNPYFNYESVHPHLILSGIIEPSNNFRRITLKDRAGNNVEGSSYITGYLVVFVPDEPLHNCETYTMDIPRDALKTSNGEVFRGYTWSFSTPVLPVKVGMQGDETVYSLLEDNKVFMRGMVVDSFKTDGTYTFEDRKTWDESGFGSVDDFSSSYTHNIRKDGSKVTGSGIAFCGETATFNSPESIRSIHAGFQTSAVVTENNALWMCGRNDFYQLCDSTDTNRKSYVKVADNILDVALGNGYSLFVDTDNVLWGVGRNHRGQLGDSTSIDRKYPVKIMDGVEKVYASTDGYFSACIGTDGVLYTWGENTSGQLGRKTEDNWSGIPASVMSGVTSVSLGSAHLLACTDNYELYGWGSNANGVISSSTKPTLDRTKIKSNVRSCAAGPNTTLILENSGRISGSGRRVHNNFGDGLNNASDFTVAEGLKYSRLADVNVEPLRYESLPENDFALVFNPRPLHGDYETVEWLSDAPEVASVDDDGVVHTSTLGEALITVKVTDRFGKTFEKTAKVICTETPVNTEVEQILSDSPNGEFEVIVNDKILTVINATPHATYRVYDSLGVLVGSTIATDHTVEFRVNSTGVYLIQSGDRTLKVICR